MHEEKMLKVAELALTQTKSGSVEWSMGENSHTYIANFEKFTAEVSWESDYYYGFCIRNADGIEIGAIREAPMGTINDLYEEARSRALRVDESLDTIIRQLTDPKPSA